VGNDSRGKVNFSVNKKKYIEKIFVFETHTYVEVIVTVTEKYWWNFYTSLTNVSQYRGSKEPAIWIFRDDFFFLTSVAWTDLCAHVLTRSSIIAIDTWIDAPWK